MLVVELLSRYTRLFISRWDDTLTRFRHWRFAFVRAASKKLSCQEQDHPGNNRGIGHIERVPVPTPQAQVYEVYHIAKPEPVDKIADRSPEHQPVRN
jgi:hypothetical protein